MEERFSKRAKRHAAESKQRTKKMLKGARSRSGPVTVSYLPGFEPPPPPVPPRLTRDGLTKFPFLVTIGDRPGVAYLEQDEVVIRYYL